jgi:hypothetical protein
MPFALSLAHAGAAVIVPEQPLLWPPNDDYQTNREGAVVVCAEHWLVDHTKVLNDGKPIVNEKNIVVREGYAYVGPRVCDPAAPSNCNRTDPFARRTPHSGDTTVRACGLPLVKLKAAIIRSELFRTVGCKQHAGSRRIWD